MNYQMSALLFVFLVLRVCVCTDVFALIFIFLIHHLLKNFSILVYVCNTGHTLKLISDSITDILTSGCYIMC